MRTKNQPHIEYINKMYVEETDTQREIKEKLKSAHISGMSLSGHEGLMLSFFIKSMNIKTIVEVGTLYGYSASWMASALPADGKIYCLENSKENFEIASGLLLKDQNKDKIELILGDAKESLNKLNAKAPFDMIFIDADKGNYNNYLTWADKNIKKGGIIIGDNTFLFGHMYNDKNTTIDVSKNQLEGMSQFNESLRDKKKYYTTMLPTVEGMTLAIKL